MTCLLLCRECGDPSRALPMTFASPAERGRWASQHTRETGHDRWWVHDLRGEGEPVIVTLDEVRERAREWLAAHAEDMARDVMIPWPAWFVPWVASAGVRAAVPPSYWRGDLADLLAMPKLPLEAFVSFAIGEDVTVPLPEGAVRREG